MRSNPEISEQPLGAGPKAHQGTWTVIWALMVLAGVAAFVLGISGPQSQRAWQAYLINFVFWSGLAFGSVVFVAVLNLTKARWARPLKRLAEALGAFFLPVSFLLFLVLWFGRKEIFLWIHQPVKGKEGWLNVGFLFARDGVGLFLLTAVALALVYFSVRSDMRFAARIAKADLGGTANPEGSNWLERPGARERAWHIQEVLSPIFAILYALVLSLVGFDLIMSLDPHWHSTLFGAYYFVGSFYTALAALIILVGISRETLGLGRVIQAKHFQDLGKLLFGFCLLTGDFFYSQFLVIWYGNLGEETKYVLLRVRHEPWEPLAWIVLVVCFGIPFVVLLSRKIKLKPGPLMVLGSVILVGMWLERLLLVAPSIWKGKGIPIGLPEVMITAGFFGALALSTTVFLRKFPVLPISDPLFRGAMEVSGSEGRRLKADGNRSRGIADDPR